MKLITRLSVFVAFAAFGLGKGMPQSLVAMDSVRVSETDIRNVLFR